MLVVYTLALLTLVHRLAEARKALHIVEQSLLLAAYL